MNHIGIYPSIMCIRSWDTKEYVSLFEKNNIDAIHFDVMDGHYVPNVMLGSSYFKDLKSITKTPIDVHIMANKPEVFIDYFPFEKGDMCSFHPDTTYQPYRLLQYIRSKGVRAGYAISPATSVEYIENSLSELDFVLVMSINPGFAGQKMVKDHLSKLKRIREICDKADHKIEIIIDGNTTIENSREMLKTGADGLVVGTSSILKGGPDQFQELYDEYMKSIKI